MDKKTLFSGIQPTGEFHLGNYLGALKNWVDLQNSGEYNCIYSVVDLHAMTIDYDPKLYQEKIISNVIDLLSLGIDPEKSILFLQSHVKEHSELCWIFNTLIPVSELERMTQYKDKSRKNDKNINMGLLDYPVLMSADVLLYNAEFVPVGEDQLQHLELANIILKKFNNKFGNYFKKVNPVLTKAPRIMSLQDPMRKMSKSMGEKNCLLLNDSEEVIRKKIMSAITDVGMKKTNHMSPGVDNLFTILELLADEKTSKKFNVDYHNGTLKYSELKSTLSDVIIEHLRPIQEKRKELLNDKKYVLEILENGRKRAENIASENMKEIKKIVGLL
ncbi:MAG TPA: tryptophan--tRNA ligase [bacterium]|nr:tryptophan--tRNA ligase [bacterium]